VPVDYLVMVQPLANNPLARIAGYGDGGYGIPREGNGLLGPKFPQATFSVVGDTALVAEASRFTPIGGFNRFHATVEARTGLPFLGDAWGSHLFLDAGRVWTVDQRFTDSADPRAHRIS
jgi:outer membrane protein assembly factor BamA